MARREVTVSSISPMPKGYAFLPKGNQYKTLHCRRLTHESGKTLFVVEENKKALGIRVPKHIFFTVQNLARETLATRRAATERRDATVIRQAEAELKALFPKIPKEEKECVLKRAFRKHSGRVGRTGQISMKRKVQLAVIAHIRHKHTEYDKLLREGLDREGARNMVRKKIQETLKDWGAKGGKRYI
ncbi:hypothetical protein K469DRAFT_603192 [Zopfia rhizophila CBS 207.26]|uniref:DUF2293 domain-containing protein n=1 Tax=Zopfia rhizophila CBS 207.26 TaxID=1314779 RepID=A0A6A6DDC7_9PEZI|nr:hypothetical protein K469DRAFT_603192 [Zopfia rhizophila CBS 207.26]